jgi:WD40 repeat protein
MSTNSNTIEVFYSYADADELLCNELEKHLSLLRHQGFISIWHKRQIIAGTDWMEILDQHLNAASIILLLVSADFLASDYCYGTEMKSAMQRHQAGDARVIPIILRTVDWQDAPFGMLKALPSNGNPVTLWSDRDAAFTDVVRGIKGVIEDLRTSPLSPPSTVRSTDPTNFPQASDTLPPSIVTPVSSQEIDLLEGRDPLPQQFSLSPDRRPFSLPRKISRRSIISVLTAFIAGSVGITWWTLAEISSQYSTANPLLVLYQGHHEAVWRVRWSLDSTRIVSGGGDHTVQIWYAYSGRPFYTYHGHRDTNVRAIAWSPDSTRIASGGDDKTVQVWDAASGALIYIYDGNKDIVWDLAWSPNGRRIASAGWDRTVQVWDAQTNQHIYTYRGHSDTVRSVTWSPDSVHIASASRDLLVRVWEADTGLSVASYNGHPTDTLMCVAWSPDGRYIASAGWDKKVQVWESITGNHVYTYSGHTEVVMEVAWSHDSKRIASASTDRTVQVWEALTGDHVYTYRGHTGRVYSVTWSPDSKYIASSQDRAVHVWQPG